MSERPGSTIDPDPGQPSPSERELARTNRALRILRSANRALIHPVDEETLLQEVCRIAVDEGGYRLAIVAFAERNEARTWRPVAYGGSEMAFIRPAIVSWAEDSEYGRGPGGTAIRTGQPSITRDIANDPKCARWRKEAARRGYRSVVALPLKSDGEAFGVLAIHSSEVDAFDAEEVAVLDELAGNLAIGITVLRARAEHARLEQQRQATLHFFASMDRINQATQSTSDLEQMTGNVLDVVLSIFECDRAWLAYPCDPSTDRWKVPTERTRPGFPKFPTPDVELPVDPEMLAMCRAVLAAHGPVTFGPGLAQPLPGDALEKFGVRSCLAMAIYPQFDRPYMFGLHQCSGARRWTGDEQLLFQEIGRRLASGVTNMQMHRNMQRSEGRLRDSLSRIERLVESNIIGIFFWNFDGHITDANGAFLGLFGYGKEELRSGEVVWSGMSPKAYIEADARAAADLRRTGTCAPYEKEFIHKDGRLIPVLIGAALLQDSTENGVAFVLDLTERKKAEAEATARQAAEASNRAKTEFLWRMSHELRTPLNAVLGFSQLLRSEAHERLTPQELVQVEHIHHAGWHLLGLINDVLDVSRIETGQMMVQPQALALAPLLEDSLSLSAPLGQAQGVALVAPQHSGSPAWVLADPMRLRQVLINLLSNAVKYNRPGGTVRVVTAISPDGADVLIDVIDDGIGMTPDQLAHLYEPFNRLGRERGGVEGTGIGLALTRQLVRLMQGRLDVDSEIGRGTRVRITLPAHAPAAAREAAPLAAAIGPAASGLVDDAAPPSGVVLYIEDNPVNLLLVEHLLARWSGVHLVQAEDGRSGIELTRSLRPDLVLLDMQLPDMDGLAVLHCLRSDAATRDLAVVALSASAMPEAVSQAREAGVLEYWTKPLDCDRFLADVHRLLQPRAPAAATTP
ncbi:MAG: ATP-binding protein [Vitreoscilla sp.]